MATEILPPTSTLSISDSVRFSAYLERLHFFTAGLNQIGFRMTAQSQVRPSRFFNLNRVQQDAVMSSLDLGIEAVAEIIGKRIDQRSSNQLAWWALRRLGLFPSSDTFTGIDENDVIEIYSKDHTQKFRTFNFFGCVSFSIDELLTYDWFRLYQRDPLILGQLMTKLTSILNGEDGTETGDSVPDHDVAEINSPRRIRARVHFVKGAMLFDSAKNVAGYMHVFRVLSMTKSSSDEVQVLDH